MKPSCWLIFALLEVVACTSNHQQTAGDPFRACKPANCSGCCIGGQCFPNNVYVCGIDGEDCFDCVPESTACIAGSCQPIRGGPRATGATCIGCPASGCPTVTGTYVACLKCGDVSRPTMKLRLEHTTCGDCEISTCQLDADGGLGVCAKGCVDTASTLVIAIPPNSARTVCRGLYDPSGSALSCEFDGGTCTLDLFSGPDAGCP